jgi:adenylate cyclase
MLFWFSVIVIIKTSLDLGKSIYDQIIFESYLNFLFSQRNFILIIYWGFVTFLGLFVLQISDKFGQGILINFLIGKYHQPKVENRIFLFMDLKASTTIAEKLGHIKYSQLIQDCYYDLTDVVIKYQAQIYQYVGDEVILTWEKDNGLKENNCLNVFFAYNKFIKRKGEYYSKKYGLIPEFKAGLNIGEITVAEVGELKKELAYHGDVLNTAARIQAKCNEFQKRLLISESIKILLESQSEFKFELIKNVQLKGKEEFINIYDVEPPITP